MTERMQEYRKRMEEKGLVQVRIWVEKRDEEFVKFIAKFCRLHQQTTYQSQNICIIIILVYLPGCGVMVDQRWTTQKR